MVAAYGQDDRVCAYTSFVAMMEMDAPKRTSCCLLTDKEEIGSVGATGMQSRFLKIPLQNFWMEWDAILIWHSEELSATPACFPLM